MRINRTLWHNRMELLKEKLCLNPYGVYTAANSGCFRLKNVRFELFNRDRDGRRSEIFVFLRPIGGEATTHDGRRLDSRADYDAAVTLRDFLRKYKEC